MGGGRGDAMGRKTVPNEKDTRPRTSVCGI